MSALGQLLSNCVSAIRPFIADIRADIAVDVFVPLAAVVKLARLASAVLLSRAANDKTITQVFRDDRDERHIFVCRHQLSSTFHNLPAVHEAQLIIPD
jgi:hypothetical protein